MSFGTMLKRTAAGAVIFALCGSCLLDGRAAAATDVDWVVRVSQESAPGAGDFDKNFLGVIAPFKAQADAAGFYGYGGSCYCGGFIKVQLVPDRTRMLFVDTADGITLMVVHDSDTDDPDGGQTEMIYEVVGDPDGMFRSVLDDPIDVQPGTDAYTGDPGDSLFTSRHLWSGCCTDGDAFSGIGASVRSPVYGTTDWIPASVIVQFAEVDGDPETLPIFGISEWTIVSRDGSQLFLALEEGRRVRLDVVQSCIDDVDGDGVIGFSDLLSILSNWGPCP